MFQLHAAPALAPAALLVSVLMLFSGQRFTHVADQISDLQSDLDDNRLALDELRETIEAFQAGDITTGEGVPHAQLATLRSTDEQINNQIRTLQETIDTLTQEIRDLRQQTADNAIIAQRAASSVSTVRPTSNRAPEPEPQRAAPAREEIASAPAPRPEPRPTVRYAPYTVRQNDTLASIADRHATTVSAIVQANALPSATIVPAAGTRLYLPQ